LNILKAYLMQKNLLYQEKIRSGRTAGKNVENFSKNRKILSFSKFDPYGFNFDFF